MKIVKRYGIVVRIALHDTAPESVSIRQKLRNILIKSVVIQNIADKIPYIFIRNIYFGFFGECQRRKFITKDLCGIQD